MAWLGVTPTENGGVPGAATHVLLALCERGARVDCFLAGSDEVPDVLRRRPEVKFLESDSWWAWGRWYSRTALLSMLSGLVARSMMQLRLVVLIARRHAQDPYDVVYQFGQIELLGLGVLRRWLPPIVLHPGTHAAGELRWHRREADLARQAGESRSKRALIQALLAVRTVVQGRDMRRVRLTIALSSTFARHLARDYRLPPEALAVVYYPIDFDRFRPPMAPAAEDSHVTMVFVAAMTVRKGVEMMVELSHRLGDDAGRVWIELVGGARQWSDYRPLLEDLDNRTAHWHGELEPGDLAEVYRRADIALQPSHYEPGGLAFLEALASGIPAVVSDEVGSAEAVHPRCCRRFPAGDADAFETAVRGLVDDVRGPERDEIRRLAHSEAVRIADREPVGEGVLQALERAAGRAHEAGV